MLVNFKKDIIMKKLIFMLGLFSIQAFATPYEIILQQLRADSSQYDYRFLPVPTTNSLLIYDPSTNLPTWVDVGTNFSYSSGMLAPIGCQANWNSVSGCSFISNKPTLGTSAALNVPSSGNASTSQVVKGDDTRLAVVYSGTTDASGNYTVNYGTAYSVKPRVIFAVEGGTNKDTSVLSSTTTTGFTIKVERRTDTLGLLPTYANVVGATVNVTITP